MKSPNIPPLVLMYRISSNSFWTSNTSPFLNSSRVFHVGRGNWSCETVQMSLNSDFCCQTPGASLQGPGRDKDYRCFLRSSSALIGFLVLFLYSSPRRRDGVLSVQYTYLSVCVYVCMYVTIVLRENWTERTEIWYTNYVGCRDVTALGAMQIVAVGSENVRWRHENSPRFTSKLKY